MKTIKELLAAKPHGEIYSIAPEATVFDAVTHMVEKNIGAVLVIGDGVIQGIITERDYLRLISVKGRTARDTPVKDVMTRRVIFVTPDSGLDDAASIMTQNRIRHLPVMADGHLDGIVSIGDVVKQISRDQKVQIRTLEEFIADDYPGPKHSEAPPR